MNDEKIRCRRLWTTPQPGNINMAVDEALLECVDRRGEPTLRFYSWSEPTLSLGYFQSAAEIPLPLAELPCVRRLTGGGAIVHQMDLTYSLVLPTHLSKHWTPRKWVTTVHDSFATSLRQSHPVLANVRRHGIADRQKQDEPFLCFERRSEDDLVCDGTKLLGSAQRKRKAQLLQHGSLPVLSASGAPHLLGLCDLMDDSEALAFDIEPFMHRSLAELGARLQFEFYVDELSDDERDAVEAFVVKHRSDSWLHERRDPAESSPN